MAGELVRRADAGETVVDSAGFLKTSGTDEEKIAALAELICRAGDEAGTKSAALLVFMATLENAIAPESTRESGEAPCFYSLQRVEPQWYGRSTDSNT